MTVAVSEYLNLITPEHGDKPNFLAAVAALVQGFVDGNNLSETFPQLYDLDLAVGVQLDVVGQWVGLTRNLSVPISGVYFAFDTAGVGFDQGVWFSDADPVEGLVALDDATYRTFLRIKIGANTWNGSYADLQRIFASIFVDSPATLFFVQDNFDMSMTLGISGILPNALFLQLLKKDYLALRPAAVLIKEIIVPSADGTPIFGFDSNNSYIGGFDVGSWAVAI